MYLPQHFEETDPVTIAALIAEHPLATLVTVADGGITADHIPLLLDTSTGERGRLIGHVARNNPVWRTQDGVAGALAIFQGPTAYISPNWYPTKQETHQVVPTYNYAVVHVHGPLVVHEDEKWLRGVVGRLTKAMEAPQPIPWKMADAPAEFLKARLHDVVGIEMPIERIVGKWKVSQNRLDVDRASAAHELEALGDAESMAMAKLILERMAD